MWHSCQTELRVCCSSASLFLFKHLRVCDCSCMAQWPWWQQPLYGCAHAFMHVRLCLNSAFPDRWSPTVKPNPPPHWGHILRQIFFPLYHGFPFSMDAHTHRGHGSQTEDSFRVCLHSWLVWGVVKPSSGPVGVWTNSLN